MLFYILNLLLVLLWSLYFGIVRIGKKNIAIFFIFIQLYLLIALRAPEVGADTQSYIRLFIRTKLFSFWDFSFSRHEWGYLFINKILSFIESPQLFIAVVSFFPLFIFMKFISKESKIPWLSIYLFITLNFYTSSFNLLRQIIGMSIITISYKYLIENNFKKFAITVLIASSFHITALIFFIVYCTKQLKINYKNLLLYIAIAFFLFLFGEQIVSLLLNKFSSVEYEIKSNGGEVLLAILVTILITGLIFKKEVLTTNPKAIILYNLLIFGILMQLLALKFPLFTRVTSYFTLFIIIFIPEVMASIKDRQLKLVGIILVFLLTGILYLTNLMNNTSNIIPYKFF